jgi:hypothetical protein
MITFQPPSGGPGATLEDLRERKFLGGEIKSLANEIRHPIEKRNRQCAPLHDERRADFMRAGGICRVVEREHSRIEKEAAVAIFRQAREPIDVLDLESGPGERFQKRIGEPLGELVEWHQSVGRILHMSERMPPGIPKIDAAKHEP